MSFSSSKNLANFDLILDSCQLSESEYEDKILTSQMIENAMKDTQCDFGKKEGAVFTFVLTFWAFLSEMFHTGTERTTQAAVTRVNQLLIASGLDGCSLNNGRYCSVRSQIKEDLPKILTQNIANNTEQRLQEEELWNGRHVGLLDGSKLYMPDTQTLQDEYPQTRSQKPGVGFPVMRFVAITSLATAMVRHLASGPWRGKETGEMALFRSLIYYLNNDSNKIDLLVADRYFCTYFAFALLMRSKVDFLARLHHRRKVDLGDYEKVKQLPNGDLIVRWDLPDRPKWMDEETYSEMPEKLELRLVNVDIKVKGWRCEHFYVATTLLDTEKYSSESISDLYLSRWNIELDFNVLKTTMCMDRLRGKSPLTVHSELWMGILAYNLIRLKMLYAARRKKMNPRHISFAAAYKAIANGYCVIPVMSRSIKHTMYVSILKNISKQKVGNRPERYEPRLVKQRQKPHDYLMEPRAVARQRLIDKTERMPIKEGPGQRAPKKPFYPSIAAVSTKYK